MSLIAIGKAFNKNGYRLLSKTKGLQLKNVPANVSRVDRVIIEDISGKQQSIYSYFNSDGKLIKRLSFNSDTPLVKETKYNWLYPKEKTARTAEYREKIDPCAFENKGLQIEKTVIDNVQKKRLLEIDRTIDINKASKTVTITDSTRKYIHDKQGYEYIDKVGIFEKVNGKVSKGLYQKSKCKPNELSEVLETSNIGIPKEVAEQALANPYFYCMFKSPLKMIKDASIRTFANQNIDLSTKLSIVPRAELKGCKSLYNKITDTINISDDSNIKTLIIDNLNHESRHKWQCELVKAYKNGKPLTKHEEELAIKFSVSMDNYKPHYKCKNNAEYESQFVEADAYQIGASSRDFYNKQIEYLQNIFKKATRKTLGE